MKRCWTVRASICERASVRGQMKGHVVARYSLKDGDKGEIV